MKHSVVIIIGTILVFAFGMQVFMFYRIHEKIDHQYAVENSLDLSSHQGSNTWIDTEKNWTPYQELFQMRDQMEQLFDHSMSQFHKNSTGSSLTKTPAINLKDEAERYVVTADVPGADESSLNVALNDRQLTISIKTESVKEAFDKNDNYHRQERFRGEFKRSLTLASDVNKNAMTTAFNNGVLTIIIPKK